MKGEGLHVNLLSPLSAAIMAAGGKGEPDVRNLWHL